MSKSFFSFCQLLCSMHHAGLGESILKKTVTPFFNRMFMGFQLLENPGIPLPLRIQT
ncbi:hypothetical protein FOMG_18975, partial [Fusarium oxysporum f. sp. melonis 26406]